MGPMTNVSRFIEPHTSTKVGTADYSNFQMASDFSFTHRPPRLLPTDEIIFLWLLIICEGLFWVRRRQAARKQDTAFHGAPGQ